MKSTLRFVLVLVLFGAVHPVLSQYDYQNLRLYLDLTDAERQTIRGEVTYTLSIGPEVETDLRFDLWESLRVSRVTLNNRAVTFKQHKQQLIIPRDRVEAHTNKTVRVVIFYQGKPFSDPSGWGGVYFSPPFVFNLGIGMASNPHPLGRAWYPALDRFDIKLPCQITLVTDPQSVGIANGSLSSHVILKDRAVWNYTLSEPISSYMLGFSAGPYKVLYDTLSAQKGPQVLRFAVPPEHQEAAQQLMHFVQPCLEVFEQAYGPHPFPFVGFVTIPFANGAMEHPTHIAYPQNTLYKPMRNQRLMAHEFAHHWWGNAITPQTQEDMWISEGFAVFSEFLYLEKQYGISAYQNAIKQNLNHIHRLAHIQDKKNFPLYGGRTKPVYGVHNYKKGADFIRTLRYFMGDSLFFNHLQMLVQNYAHSHLNTQTFYELLEPKLSPSQQEWTRFALYDDDYLHIAVTGLDQVSKDLNRWQVTTQTRRRFGNRPLPAMPIQITLFGQNLQKEVHQVAINKRLDTFYLNSQIEPVYALTDFLGQIGTATLDTSILIFKQVNEQNIQHFDPQHVYAGLSIEYAINPSLFRLEHHWVNPGQVPTGNPLPFVSNYRYWVFDGVWGSEFEGKLRFYYNGSTDGSDPSAFLDHNLIRVSEDSLVLLYRAHNQTPWVEVADAQFFYDDKFDKKGYIEVDVPRAGQYTLGIYDPDLANIPRGLTRIPEMNMTPNPASTHVLITLPPEPRGGKLVITNSIGEIVESIQTFYSDYEIRLDLTEYNPGSYNATYYSLEGGMVNTRFSVEK